MGPGKYASDGLLWENPNHRDDAPEAPTPHTQLDEMDPKAEETRLDRVYAEAAAESQRGRKTPS